MLRWLQTAREFLGGALRRLPVETVLVGAAAIAGIAAVHEIDPLWVARVALAALVATPVAFAAHGLGRRRAILVGAVAALASLAALTVWVGEIRDLDQPWFHWPYGLVLLAALLLPFVVAARRFTPFVRRFFEQTTTWGLLLLVATAALGVVFYAANELFEVNFRFFFDVFFVLAGAITLSWLHSLLPDAGPAEGGRMPEIWRRLATTVGAPFVSVMLLLLVAYEIVVLARGQLPRNLLSPLIMAAGFVGCLCTLVIAAVVEEPVGSAALAPADPHRFTRRLSVRLVRAFPLVLLALLPMAVWALWVRVDQYGLTPFRVVRLASLLCLAVICVAGAVRWARKRPPLGWEVPATIGVFALACALGALRVSISSQATRLERLLVAVGLTTRAVPRQEPPPSLRIAPGDYAELEQTLETLWALGGDPALRLVLSGQTELCANGYSGAEQCLRFLGVAASEPERAYASLYAAGPYQLLDGGSLDMVTLSGKDADRNGLSLSGTEVVHRDAAGRLARASLEAQIAGWRTTTVLPAPVVRLVRGDGGVAGQLVIQDLTVAGIGEGGVEINGLRGVWLPR